MKLFQNDNLATANIWAEARGELFEGKCAVGEVMRNRMKLKYFSNGTVADTIFRAKQFSGFNDDNPWRHEIFELDDSDQLVRDCFRAWTMSETTGFARGAVLYCNLAIATPVWAIPGDLVATVGKHSFYLPANLRK